MKYSAVLFLFLMPVVAWGFSLPAVVSARSGWNKFQLRASSQLPEADSSWNFGRFFKTFVSQKTTTLLMLVLEMSDSFLPCEKTGYTSMTGMNACATSRFSLMVFPSCPRKPSNHNKGVRSVE
jgi:hypothetical protein